jgi:aminomuconate-semialdehyde/2-hydroxymuconate-6-semialdehyde dehydrogenase
MPFGGTKDSGIGREGTADSMDFYTEQKTICVKLWFMKQLIDYAN